MTYLLLQFGVLLLGMNEVEDDVECAGENEGEEEAETSEIGIALCARCVGSSVQWQQPLQRY